MVACVKAASFVNFCVFVCYGHYAFIVERMLGVRAVYPSRPLLRQVWILLIVTFVHIWIPLHQFKHLHTQSTITIPLLHVGCGSCGGIQLLHFLARHFI